MLLLHSELLPSSLHPRLRKMCLQALVPHFSEEFHLVEGRVFFFLLHFGLGLSSVLCACISWFESLPRTVMGSSHGLGVESWAGTFSCSSPRQRGHFLIPPCPAALGLHVGPGADWGRDSSSSTQKGARSPGDRAALPGLPTRLRSFLGASIWW